MKIDQHTIQRLVSAVSHWPLDDRLLMHERTKTVETLSALAIRVKRNRRQRAFKRGRREERPQYKARLSLRRQKWRHTDSA